MRTNRAIALVLSCWATLAAAGCSSDRAGTADNQASISPRQLAGDQQTTVFPYVGWAPNTTAQSLTFDFGKDLYAAFTGSNAGRKPLKVTYTITGATSSPNCANTIFATLVDPSTGRTLVEWESQTESSTSQTITADAGARGITSQEIADARLVLAKSGQCPENFFSAAFNDAYVGPDSVQLAVEWYTCDATCSECNGSGADQCTRCIDGYQFDNNGYCVPIGGVGGATGGAGGATGGTGGATGGAGGATGGTGGATGGTGGSGGSGATDTGTSTGTGVFVRLSLSTISPNSGGIAGGTTVEIGGGGFIAGSTIVQFDGIAGTSVTVLGPNKLTVVTPAHAKGEVNVTVFNGSDMGTLTKGFTYTDSLTPTSLDAGIDDAGTDDAGSDDAGSDDAGIDDAGAVTVTETSTATTSTGTGTATSATATSTGTGTTSTGTGTATSAVNTSTSTVTSVATNTGIDAGVDAAVVADAGADRPVADAADAAASRVDATAAVDAKVDGGADASTPIIKKADEGCSCNVGSRTAHQNGGVILLVLGSVLVAIRRKRTRR